MKETGVIRRIDELGRVVIPKEIRKKLKIRNGDSLDIFISNDKIVLNKYSPLKDLETLLEILVDSINKMYNTKLIITDMSSILYSNELSCNKALLHQDFIKKLEEINNPIEISGINITDSFNPANLIKIVPITVYGDLFGSIISLTPDNKSNDLIQIINTFIVNYLES